MIRTLDSKIANEIANHPEIRPNLGGKGHVNLTNIIENPANFCLLTDTEDGAYILVNKGNGIYEVHTLSYPAARGRSMFKLMREARAFMFVSTDCVELNTYVPEGLKAANLWACNSGFREDFKRENCFDLDGQIVGCSYYSLTYEDWVLKDIINFTEGQEFHKLIEPNHDNDRVHDYWAGATIRAVKSYNHIKGVSFYNKWANRVGYLPISVVSFSPLVIDIKSHILQLGTAGNIQLLKVN